MKNSFNVVSTLTQNHWALVALAFIAIAVVIGASQYCIRGHRLIKRFGDEPYLLMGIAGAITIGVMMFVESHAGIIQLLDNLLTRNESPILSVILMPFVAMMLGIGFGTITAIIGDLAASFRKRSLINKLRLAAEASRKAAHRRPQQIRRGQPTGNPRPGAIRPTRYKAGRDLANHYQMVNAGYGMRRR